MAKIYIDPEVAKTFLQENLESTISDSGVEGIIRESYEMCIKHTLSYIKFIPAAADVVEVRHGKWEYGRWEQGHWVKGNERCKCSVCGRDFAVDNLNIWYGCPHCLARMDGKDEEENATD